MIFNKDSWYLVQTKVAAEARAREHLERQGYHCYLPMARNPLRRRRVRRAAQPLFARYLFVAVALEQALAPIDSTFGVSRLVRFGSAPAVVPDWVIDGLRAASCAETGLVKLGRPELTAGDPVEVFGGPMAGLRGIFQAPDGNARAWLLVELLGQSRRVSLPLDNLRAAR